ncbi:hypothetical protein OnM2_047088 [Erysiphe neolycopersici]|uniref:Uncharacterized protein n=1 Tax=Erysiphe neolycopersici TaxID=212602 RepID=A0A420HTL1_9PEZI|nr:hypothetical protein OnM2_047088 [Erysiphe neolycopersici]
MYRGAQSAVFRDLFLKEHLQPVNEWYRSAFRVAFEAKIGSKIE